MKRGTGAVLVFALIAACAPAHANFGRATTRKEREAALSPRGAASRLYERIHECFLSDDHVSVERLSGEYLETPRQPKAQDVKFLRALSLVKLGRGAEARAELERLEYGATNPEKKARAAAAIGDSFVEEGDHSSAYRIYQDTLRRYPSFSEAPFLLERLAAFARELGHGREADYFGGRLSAEFPGWAPPGPPQSRPLGRGAVEERPHDNAGRS